MTGPPETATPASELARWWAERRAAWREARLVREQEDPGVPLYHGTCLGEPTPHPWSAVLGARVQLHRVINLDKVRHRLLDLMGIK